MSKKIKELLVELLRHENVVGSWGITDIKIGEDHISFLVSAFNYKGRVQIQSKYESYSLELNQKAIGVLELSGIVDTIDKEIETSADYYEKVARWIEEKK